MESVLTFTLGAAAVVQATEGNFDAIGKEHSATSSCSSTWRERLLNCEAYASTSYGENNFRLGCNSFFAEMDFDRAISTCHERATYFPSCSKGAEYMNCSNSYFQRRGCGMSHVPKYNEGKLPEASNFADLVFDCPTLALDPSLPEDECNKASAGWGHCSLSECRRDFTHCKCGVQAHQVSGPPHTLPDPLERVSLQATLDVPFLNYGPHSDYCAAFGVGAYPYTAWHRSESSGFVAVATQAAATKYGDTAGTFRTLFDIYGYDVMEGSFSSDQCRRAFREYFCYTVRPQAKFDSTVGAMRTCNVCRDLCTAFVAACSEADRNALFELTVGSFPSQHSVLEICYTTDVHEALSTALQKFLFPNCSTGYDTADCTASNDPTTCAAVVPPVAMFGDFESQTAGLTDGAPVIRFTDELLTRGSDGGVELRLFNGSVAVRPSKANSARPRSTLIVPPGAKLVLSNLGSVLPSNSRNAHGRADQYTVIMDVQFRTNPRGEARFNTRAACSMPFDGMERFDGAGNTEFWKKQDTFLDSDAEGFPVRSSCFLTIFDQNDSPVWPTELETNPNYLAFVHDDFPLGRTAGRCSVLGIMEGCFGEIQGACGSKFATGRGIGESIQLSEEYVLRQERVTNATLNDKMMRITLSVDLIAGYVRTFVNTGEGPRMVGDERWLVESTLGCSEAAKEARNCDADDIHMSSAFLRTNYLNPDGNLGLANEMLVATDCFSTTELGALTVYPAALPEAEIRVLTGPPGSPTSFLLDVTPRSVSIRESPTGSSRTVKVKLLHPPRSTVDVSLGAALHSTRVRIEPPHIRFSQGNWQTPQEINIKVVDDDLMQSEVVETLEAAITSSEPVVWKVDLDDVVSIHVKDDDIAAVVAHFDEDGFNATKGDNNTVTHHFPLPLENCPEEYICRLKVRATEPSTGAIAVSRNVPATYTLRLGSEPWSPVQINIEIEAVDQDNTFIVAVPSSVSFDSRSWSTPQIVTLFNHNDDEGKSIAHLLTHVVSSKRDIHYDSQGVGVLPFDVLAHAVMDQPEAEAELHRGIIAMVAVLAVLLFAGAAASVRHRMVLKRRIVAVESQIVQAQSLAKNLSVKNKALQKSLVEAKQIIDKVKNEGGTLLDQYAVPYDEIHFTDTKLGEGSFGTVKLAKFYGKDVAVKTVRTTKVSESCVREFLQEIRTMAPLSHPNLVRLFGGVWDEGPDKLCIVLEYCANGTLKGLLKRGTELTWAKDFYDIVFGTALCFKYLHHEISGDPVIHRDLKPDNVLVAADMSAKVADFGESRRFDIAEASQSSGSLDMLEMTMVGTPLYCAPEIVLCMPYNSSCDVFSYAVLLMQVACVSFGESWAYVRSEFRDRTAWARGLRPRAPSCLADHALLWSLITDSWVVDQSERPDFKQIVVRIKAIGKDPRITASGAEARYALKEDAAEEALSKKVSGKLANQIVTLFEDLRADAAEGFAASLIRDVRSEGFAFAPAKSVLEFSQLSDLENMCCEALGVESDEDLRAWSDEVCAAELAIYKGHGPEWTELSGTHGVKVEVRQVSGCPYRLRRFTVTIAGTKAKSAFRVASMKLGTPLSTTLGDRSVIEQKVLASLGSDNKVRLLYQSNKMPRGIPNRHFLTLTVQDTNNFMVVNRDLKKTTQNDAFVSAIERQHLPTGLVLGEVLNYGFRFQPTNDDQDCVFTVVICLDPSGNIPSLLMNANFVGISMAKGVQGMARSIKASCSPGA